MTLPQHCTVQVVSYNECAVLAGKVQHPSNVVTACSQLPISEFGKVLISFLASSDSLVTLHPDHEY